MKRIKISLALVAVVLGIMTSAFTKMPTQNQAKTSDLFWFNAGVTTQSISTVDNTDDATEKMSSGCPHINSGCKDGYTAVIDNGNGTYTAAGDLAETLSHN